MFVSFDFVRKTKEKEKNKEKKNLINCVEDAARSVENFKILEAQIKPSRGRPSQQKASTKTILPECFHEAKQRLSDYPRTLERLTRDPALKDFSRQKGWDS